ncbi:hypothetical protein [Salmonella enterica]
MGMERLTMLRYGSHLRFPGQSPR